MPLMPKRVKHRKVQRGSRAGLAQTNTELSQGDYGLKTLERGWITAIQIEACRVCINRHLKRRGKLWIRIFPDKPVSKKPIGVRMGKVAEWFLDEYQGFAGGWIKETDA